MRFNKLAGISFAAGLAALSGCATARTSGEAEPPSLEFPPPTLSRKVNPGDSFGLKAESEDRSNWPWKAAVKIEVSVVELGYEKATMGERELALEKADLELILNADDGAEILHQPVVVTFPGQVDTIEPIEMTQVFDALSRFGGEVWPVPEGFMASLLVIPPKGIDRKTPISELRERGVSLHMLAAINERTGESFGEIDGNPVPVIHQFEIYKKLALKPGVAAEAGRITRERTLHLNDKIPILADIPLIGKLPLFRPPVDLEVRKTTIITVRADWVGPEDIEYQQVARFQTQASFLPPLNP